QVDAASRRDCDLIDGVDDAARIFKSAEKRMRRTRGGIFLEAQVGVEHVFLNLACIRRAEERGKTKIIAAHSRLIVERGFVSGDESPALFDELAQAGALRVRESSNVGQDERAEGR